VNRQKHKSESFCFIYWELWQAFQPLQLVAAPSLQALAIRTQQRKSE
jgi:hypothetical protein